MKAEDGAGEMIKPTPKSCAAAWMEAGTLLSLLLGSLALHFFASSIERMDASMDMKLPILAEWICRANVAVFVLGISAAAALFSERLGLDRGCVDRTRRNVFARLARDRGDESISRVERYVLVRICVAIGLIFVVEIGLIFATIGFIETGLMAATPMRGWMTPGVDHVEMEHPDAASPISFSRFGAGARFEACRPRAQYPTAVRDYVGSMPGRSGIMVSQLQQIDPHCMSVRGCRTVMTEVMIRMDPAIVKPGPLYGFELWACTTEDDVAAALSTNSESSLREAQKSAAQIGPDLEYLAGEWCARAPGASSQDMELRTMFHKRSGVMVGSFALAQRAREGYPLGTQNWVSRGEFYPVAEEGKDVILREVSRSGTGTKWRLSLDEGSLRKESQHVSIQLQLNRSCRGYWQPSQWPPPN